VEKSLLYVSKSLIPPERKAEVMRDIVLAAQSRNASLGVTGALIATDSHFAHFLEGASEAIDDVMGSISKDPRHTDVQVIHDSAMERRRFPKWSMAYSALATYVAHYVEPLLSDTTVDHYPDNARQLTRLMDKLVHG
jgi:hypothetical protein